MGSERIRIKDIAKMAVLKAEKQQKKKEH